MQTTYKYPRTPHLPWSEGRSNDDKVLSNIDHFIGKEIIVTEKFDGENSTLANTFYHARSLDSKQHPSRDWLKKFHGEIKHLIPDGWRICGENLYATHSIHYTDLESYFYGFSVWDGDKCFSWDNSVEIMEDLGIVPVPVLYRGIFNETAIKACYTGSPTQEGYVVRLAESFNYSDFGKSIAKFVRSHHVQTDEHWMLKPVIPNQLKNILK